jgi:hypothetical protein
MEAPKKWLATPQLANSKLGIEGYGRFAIK